MENIQITHYEDTYKRDLLQFELSDEQKKFTGMPADVLELSIQDSNRFPVVILNDGKAVGFFVLHLGEEILPFSENPQAILLRAFSIDSKAQGKGFGKEAMKRVPAFVKENFTGIDEIVLAVNLKNLAAKNVYDQAGFVDQGIRKEGRIGFQYILHYKLE